MAATVRTRGLPGLEDRPRSGRRRRFTPVQVAEVKALACTLPAETGRPLSRWSSGELATEAITREIAETISAATVRRWLAADAIKPWQHRSWIFPRDPAFAIKGARVLDLYARRWEGRPLGPDDYVISADEKSQLQALHRRHRGQPPAAGRTRRVEFEYRRGGTLAYFAAYDVHHARVLGQIAPKTGIEPFEKLVAEVMTTEPYASARRVFWVVDNGSSHNGARSIARMHTAWPTATLVHLPIHASWLNQVEIYFSILQRKAITPTTSPTSTNSRNESWAFRTATTPPRHHSTGPTPETSSTPSSNASTSTAPAPTPHDPRRTYDRDH